MPDTELDFPIRKKEKIKMNEKSVADLFPLTKDTDFKLHVAKSNGSKEPFDVFKRDFEEWKGWNQYKGRKNRFNRRYIFSIIKYPNEADTYVFAGIFEVIGRTEDHYEVELCKEYSELIGKLFIDFHFIIRGSSFKLEGNLQNMHIKDSYANGTKP